MVESGRTADPRVLEWRALSADTVYYIAHLEHEARVNAAEMLGSVVSAGQTSPETQALLYNNDRRADSWLADQAAMRGLIAATRHKSNRDIPNTPHISAWLRAQYDLSGAGLRAIAASAGISPGYLSKIGNGLRSNPSPEVAIQLAGAFARVRGLDAH